MPGSCSEPDRCFDPTIYLQSSERLRGATVNLTGKFTALSVSIFVLAALTSVSSVSFANDPKARPSVIVLSKEEAKKKTVAPKRTSSLFKVPLSELSTQPVIAPRSTVKPAVTVSTAHGKIQSPDLASDALKSCLLSESVQGKSALVCMNRELRNAETLLDSAEVRMFNCAELRKIEKAADPVAITQLVASRRDQLRERAQSQFKAELESSGQVGPRKTREIELRATLNHLDAVSKLNKKVCDPQAFTALLSK